MRELVDSLVEMGHRRIVLINCEDRRKPPPGGFEQEFLKQLEHHGIQHNGDEWTPCAPKDYKSSFLTPFSE